MQQIPCRIYDLKNEYTQTPEAAERKLWEQCLTGDSTDGYSGAPGFGPKRADLILDKVKSSSDYWPTVVAAYESVGLHRRRRPEKFATGPHPPGIGLGQRNTNPDSL